MHFADDERKAFRYQTHGGEVAADPLELLERVSRTAGDLGTIAAQANRPLQGSDPVGLRIALGAQERLSFAVRSAFGFVDFDRVTGKGDTESLVFLAWRRFCTYLTERKDSCRKQADAAAVYGILPEPLTYDAWVGLMLNLERQRWWTGFVVAHALAVAAGAELSAAMMDPVASSDREAEEMAFDANADREFQKARQKVKSGGLS